MRMAHATHPRFVISCVICTGLMSLACGGPDFGSMLDEHGGVSLVLTGEPGCALDDVQQVLEQRLASDASLFGVVSVDQAQVHVQLAGESVDRERATAWVQPYRVEFAQVLRVQRGSPLAGGRWLTTKSDPGNHMLVSDPSELGPDTVSSARQEFTDYGPVVMVTLTPDGADAFAALTAAQVGEKIAIILDGEVVSAPIVNEEIRGGSIQIAVSDWDDALPLAAAVNTPALPCELTLTETNVLGPTGRP
ncbi:MAG: preprotein translocase subunit SecD [Myxococcota bacterium]|jgi:preprotein translocase subunit SecD